MGINSSSYDIQATEDKTFLEFEGNHERIRKRELHERQNYFIPKGNLELDKELMKEIYVNIKEDRRRRQKEFKRKIMKRAAKPPTKTIVMHQRVKFVYEMYKKEESPKERHRPMTRAQSVRQRMLEESQLEISSELNDASTLLVGEAPRERLI